MHFTVRFISKPFAEFSSFENTIPRLKTWLDVAVQWLELTNVFTVKYEDLIGKPIQELQRLAKFLGINTDNIDLKSIFYNYSNNKLDGWKKDYLHFNIGRAGRFREIMGEEDLLVCNRHFAKYFEKMSYKSK